MCSTSFELADVSQVVLSDDTSNGRFTRHVTFQKGNDHVNALVLSTNVTMSQYSMNVIAYIMIIGCRHTSGAK